MGSPPSPGKVCKVFIADDLGLDFDGYAVLKSLQSMPRVVKSSFPCLKVKKPRPFGSGFPVFLSFCFYYSCWSGTFCHVDVVDCKLVRWSWGLTCDFWAEK